jgi:hypothetical protein
MVKTTGVHHVNRRCRIIKFKGLLGLEYELQYRVKAWYGYTWKKAGFDLDTLLKSRYERYKLLRPDKSEITLIEYFLMLIQGQRKHERDLKLFRGEYKPMI